MFFVVDGLSRSGKLLLGKILLSSSSILSQSYTGYFERLVETIYFDSFAKKDTNSLKELLRLYFVHTIEDLNKFRLLSLNPLDSSYYRNSSTYRLNKKSIDSGVFEPDLNKDYLFVNHTHESIDFHCYMADTNENLIKEYIKEFIVIVRNPSSQILSWSSRNYFESWRNYNSSSFKLYKLIFENHFLKSKQIHNVPWFVNESFKWALSMQFLSNKDLINLKKNDIIALCVIFLLEKYLSYFISNKSNKKFQPIFITHESIHDDPEKTINKLFKKLKIETYSNDEFTCIINELSSEKFGIESAEYSLRKCIGLKLNGQINYLLHELDEKYKKVYLSIEP